MINVKLENGQLMFSEVFEIRNGIQSHKFMDKVINFMNHLKDSDGKYELVIQEYKSTRSIEQNKTLWMWIDIIAPELGYADQELYDALIESFAPNYTIKDLDGKPKQKKLTTSRMNVDQMSRFLMCVERLASEHNINIPIPK